jgi:hypothetical protein
MLADKLLYSNGAKSWYQLQVNDELATESQGSIVLLRADARILIGGSDVKVGFRSQ